MTSSQQLSDSRQDITDAPSSVNAALLNDVEQMRQTRGWHGHQYRDEQNVIATNTRRGGVINNIRQYILSTINRIMPSQRSDIPAPNNSQWYAQISTLLPQRPFSRSTQVVPLSVSADRSSLESVIPQNVMSEDLEEIETRRQQLKILFSAHYNATALSQLIQDRMSDIDLLALISVYADAEHRLNMILNHLEIFGYLVNNHHLSIENLLDLKNNDFNIVLTKPLTKEGISIIEKLYQREDNSWRYY